MDCWFNFWLSFLCFFPVITKGIFCLCHLFVFLWLLSLANRLTVKKVPKTTILCLARLETQYSSSWTDLDSSCFIDALDHTHHCMFSAAAVSLSSLVIYSCLHLYFSLFAVDSFEWWTFRTVHALAINRLFVSVLEVWSLPHRYKKWT